MTGKRPLALADPVAALRGVGPARAAALGGLGVATVGDLLRLAPRRYETWEGAREVASVRRGEEVTVRVEVVSVRLHRMGRRRSLLRVRCADASGEIEALFFNQPYLRDRFRPGGRIALHGRVGGVAKPALLAPRVETKGRPFPEAGAIVPVYPQVEGAGSALLRSLLAEALPLLGQVRETLGEEIRRSLRLPPLAQALRALHAPASLEEAERARRRLGFEELLLLQRRFARARARARRSRAAPIRVDEALDRRIRSRFPFPLTSGQERAVAEIRADLASGRPMRRLLQGDVGCGKTLVALYACLAAIGCKGQAAFLAPTAILAEQHRALFAERLRGSRVRIECLTGGKRGPERRQAEGAIASGEASLVVGTHALLEEEVKFRSLALAVLDEQHRFGVGQRRALLAKGEGVHALALTATPIPRTLAMALYGDLDVSTIQDFPAGRGRRATVVSSDRGGVLREARRRVLAGEKAFWICPRIGAEEGALEETPEGARAVEQVHRRFAAREFAGIPIGLVHGRQSAEGRSAAFARFRSGEVRLLVSTSVVEVGVDVPDATVLVVEGAEAFGLATLHQLRGRVGRGPQDARCFFLAGAAGAERLGILAESEDGFRLAEEDLRRRGPGEILGLRQSGFPVLRFADPLRDLDLLEAARSAAAAEGEGPLSPGEGGTILAGAPAAAAPAPAVPASTETEVPSPCSPS